MRRPLLASVVPLAFLSASMAHASAVERHLVRVDVVEISAGCTPRARHFDVVVANDGSVSRRAFGAYRVEVRWSERQEGKPSLALKLDRDGASPMHFASNLRALNGVPQFRFGSSAKGVATEVFVTVS